MLLPELVLLLPERLFLDLLRVVVPVDPVPVPVPVETPVSVLVPVPVPVPISVPVVPPVPVEVPAPVVPVVPVPMVPFVESMPPPLVPVPEVPPELLLPSAPKARPDIAITATAVKITRLILVISLPPNAFLLKMASAGIEEAAADGIFHVAVFEVRLLYRFMRIH